MYKCQKCGKTTQPHEKSNKIIVGTKEKEYIIKKIDKKGIEHTKVTRGYEITEEMNVCDKCYREVLINE